MRVNSADNSLYTYQANLQNVSGNNVENKDVSGKDVAVIVELSPTVPVKKETEPAEETVSKKVKVQAQKDWKSLQEWARDAAEKAKELWKKLTEKAVEMATKIGNLWQQEKRPAENGVPQATWQENFRRRVKIMFDAVAGFLSKHLPMGSGNFSEAKEETKEEELTGKNDSKEEKKENGTSSFDVRG